MSTPPPRMPDASEGSEGMPRPTKAARLVMFAACGLILLVGVPVLALTLSDPDEFERIYDVEVSTGLTGSLVYVVYGLLGLVLASLFGRQGRWLRVGALAWAGCGIAIGLLMLPVGVLVIALVVLILVLLSRSTSRDWFSPPDL